MEIISPKTKAETRWVRFTENNWPVVIKQADFRTLKGAK